MNEEQKKWTKRHCDELYLYLKDQPVLSDDVSEAATGYVKVIVALSKDNAEVRSALFDVLEAAENRAKELMSVNGNG